MEIMEDGNLVDRVRILLQRDLQYYQDMQTILKESLCVRVSGGKLDFPRYASFAAVKIVTWWEADFLAAFKKVSGLSGTGNNQSITAEAENGVIKKIQPSEFILLVVDTAEQLLEHLHNLIQESLDHADLTVLTATLGAAALVRNCLWCYTRYTKGTVSVQSSEKLNTCHKLYHDMAEAVAERLLDLHCRLISLYILSEADSLSWHSDRPFFEKERCSFVIQMWWLYMQGTKADLWNTVPPKLAQRVFSGMLNESLSIITTRFIHGRPSLARSQQFWTDAFNILRCTGYLALGACTDSGEMINMRSCKLPITVRDMHAKCNELLVCLLLRGTPLKDLYQVLRNGLENLAITHPQRGPSPWLLICAPNLLGSIDSDVYITSLPEDRTVILELNVLRHQPEPNWARLVNVITMNNYIIAKLLLKILIQQCIGITIKDTDNTKNMEKSGNNEKHCGGFLCTGTVCERSTRISPSLELYSLIYVLAMTIDEPKHVLIPMLKEDPNWFNYLDRQQVWNQERPPWLNALLKLLMPMMQPIVEILLEAVKTGASIYQAMSLAIGCFAELYVTVPVNILRTAFALDDNLPVHCHPIGGSVLLQIMCASLYAALLVVPETHKQDSAVSSLPEPSSEDSLFDPNDRSATAIALAEAICSIDEDNKHTAQIDSFLLIVQEGIKTTDGASTKTKLCSLFSIIEMHTDELLFNEIGRRTLKVTHEYLIRISDWVLNNLQSTQKKDQKDIMNLPTTMPAVKHLTHIMFHIEDTTFDQFMTDYEGTNWRKVLTLPLSTTIERVRNQVLIRPEFKNIAELPAEEREVVNSIKRLCAAIRLTRCT